MSKNVIIGQSGGPTAVINSSLAGVYKAACSLGADLSLIHISEPTRRS